MSAFVCSDKHIATIAVTYGNLTGIPKGEVQKLADQLKRWNIRSVNFRYNKRARIKPCCLDDVEPMSPADIVQLCNCLEYQSCERPDWNTDCDGVRDSLKAIRGLFQVLADHSPMPLRESHVWSI